MMTMLFSKKSIFYCELDKIGKIKIAFTVLACFVSVLFYQWFV